jgi:hypothetical protein
MVRQGQRRSSIVRSYYLSRNAFQMHNVYHLPLQPNERVALPLFHPLKNGDLNCPDTMVPAAVRAIHVILRDIVQIDWSILNDSKGGPTTNGGEQCWSPSVGEFGWGWWYGCGGGGCPPGW